MIKPFLLAISILFSGSVLAQEASPPVVQTVFAPQYFALYVSNFESSSAWYQQMFELEVKAPSQADNGSWRIENLVNNSLHIELIFDVRAEAVDRAIGFRKVGFSVVNVDTVADRLEAQFGSRPEIIEFEPLRQKILQVRDPDGNIIQLASPMPE
jgi:predicted enzyme related to lactoylglutathione lyase